MFNLYKATQRRERKMQIHTFEMRKRIKKEFFLCIKNELKKQGHFKISNNSAEFFGLSSKGINLRLIRHDESGYVSYMLLYILTPARVFEPENYIALFDVSNYEKLKTRINSMLAEVSTFLPPLDMCKLGRVDFTFNAKFDTENQVAVYLKFLQKALIPPDFKIKSEYDITTHHRKPLPNQMTISKENDIELSIYDKYAQMREDENTFSSENLESARRILRFEIRCKKKNLKKIYHLYNCSSVDDFFKKTPSIGKDLFNRFFLQMFGPGKILSKNEAKAFIDKHTIKSDVKRKLVYYLKDGFAGLSKKSCKTIRKHFAKMGICLIFMPKKKREVFGEEMPSVSDLYQRFMS